jgi:hypothetical protein
MFRCPIDHLSSPRIKAKISGTAERFDFVQYDGASADPEGVELFSSPG